MILLTNTKDIFLFSGLRKQPDRILIPCNTFPVSVRDLIQPGEIAVMPKIRQLDGTCDLIVAEFCHIIHVRHVRVMGQQRHSRKDLFVETHAAKIFHRIIGIFNHVVEQCRDRSRLVRHLLSQMIGMKHIGQTALIMTRLTLKMKNICVK